ncbi:MAG: hypothetical protein KJ888_20190 [Gammaproteobacteria bacterium]|nr:hypothetical protein [Gammaproteobacteria bacterium]
MTLEAVMTKDGRIYQLPNMPAKEREVRVGDVIRHWAAGYFREGEVTKVTKNYIWVSYTSPSTGQTHNTRRHRSTVLLPYKFY